MREEGVVDINNTLNLTVVVRSKVVVGDRLNGMPVGIGDGFAGLPAGWGFLDEKEVEGAG